MDVSLLLSGAIGFSLGLLLLPSLQVDRLLQSTPQHHITNRLQQDRQTLLQRLQHRLNQTQVGLHATQYLFLSACLGFVAVWLSGLVLQSFWLAMPAFLAGFLFTERLISVLSERRKERFEAANVRAIRLMASSLRTSPSYLHAFEQVADSPFVDKVVADEYKQVLSLLRGQIPLERVMKEFYERTGSPNVAYMATIVQVQREMGGDMAKTLDLAAFSILRRRQSQRRQKAAMSQILAQVNLLSVMPFVFVFTLYVNNPHHFDPLTATTRGRLTMLGSLLSILVGGEVIRLIAGKGLYKG